MSREYFLFCITLTLRIIVIENQAGQGYPKRIQMITNAPIVSQMINMSIKGMGTKKTNLSNFGKQYFD